ncbi:hypothetical protein ACLB2K_032842 [Fragaria x ananassa]
MTDSRPTPDAGPTLSTDEVRKMFEELRSDFKNEIGSLRSELGLKVDATQQNVQVLSAQVAKDKEIWLANQENHARLSEEFNYVAGTVREDKDMLTGSLQRIQTELDQSKVAFTKALEVQTRRLDDHDTKLQQQQDASFFGSKNSMEKLEDYKERHDTLNTRVLQVEDWIRAQAPKNHAMNYASSSAAEGSRYIPSIVKHSQGSANRLPSLVRILPPGRGRAMQRGPAP